MALDPVVPEIPGLDGVDCITLVAQEQFRKHRFWTRLLIRDKKSIVVLSLASSTLNTVEVILIR